MLDLDNLDLGLDLGQQNGIKVVLIALTPERDFPGTATTVGPAVITVNVLHATSQALPAQHRNADAALRLPA